VSSWRAISLFSNCGAGDIGFRSAGFRFDVMAEIDSRRLEVCLLNHPGAVGVPGDLRDTWPKVVKQYRKRAGDRRPALLSACPPCQGMSSARSGKGRHDDADAGSRDQRNLLVTVIAKVALRLQPSIVVVENVPAFLTRKVRHPHDEQPISAANYLLAALSKDYVVFPLVADLCHYGVPQSRTRAFLTFIRHDLAGLTQLLRLGRAPYPRPTYGDELGLTKPISLDDALASFALPDLDASTPGQASADGFDDFHSVPVWNERTYAMVAAIPPGSGRSAWQNDACFRCGAVEVLPSVAECPKCGDPLLRPVVREPDGSIRLIKGFETSYRRMLGDRPAATITTASGHVGSDVTIHPRQNRVLSTLECALLQTFPQDFEWGDALKKWGPTNVREMIGEAVPPAFTQVHGEVLLGLFRKQWTRAPISLSDDRITRAWRRLVEAARKDGRRNPQTFVSYLPPPLNGGLRRDRLLNAAGNLGAAE
jgi:DNA (cytosine-5)-methyltransferase 1